MQEEADEDAEEGAATKTAEGGFVRGGVTYRVGRLLLRAPRHL